MSKTIVIGSPGAGKSTFARQLAQIRQLPLYHLDMIWHKADGTTVSAQEFNLRLAEILRQPAWIIDGNYQRTLETRIKACDTIILLDFPLAVCLSGARNRIGKKREDMPWIETSLDETFKQTIIDFPIKKLPIIYQLLEKYKSDKNIIIFKTRAEADSYLEII